MSRGRTRTAGQRLGRLTGFALIVGGIAGWTWSLLQAPGKTDASPVAIPQPPAAEPAELTAPIATVAATLNEAAAEKPVPTSPTVADTDDGSADEPDVEQEEAIADRPGSPPAAEASKPDVPAAAAPPAATAPPAPTAAKSDVPDAVKAIRAAAAAARERLEAPAKALPDAAPAPVRTDTGE